MRVMIKPSKVQKLMETWIDNGELKYKHHIIEGKIILDHEPIAIIR